MNARVRNRVRRVVAWISSRRPPEQHVAADGAMSHSDFDCPCLPIDDTLRPLGVKVRRANVLTAIAKLQPVGPSVVGELLRIENSTLSRNLVAAGAL